MKDILIIGANGFVGYNIGLFLAAKGHQVTGLCRGQHRKNNSIAWLKADGLLEVTLQNYLAEHPDCVVIHAGGRINANARKLHHDNVNLTQKIVNVIKYYQPQTPLIYISSVAAENELGIYGAKKKQAETIIETQLEHWLILRSTLLYGPHDKRNLNLLVNMVQTWPIIPLPGAKEIKIQPLYIYDLAQVVANYIEHGADNNIYTVAGADAILLSDLVTELQDVLKTNKKIISMPLQGFAPGLKLLERVLPNFPAQQIHYCIDQKMWDTYPAQKDLQFKASSLSDNFSKLQSR